MMPMKLLGINELEDGARLAKVAKGSTTHTIIIPPGIKAKDEGKYIQKEVNKYERQFTTGQF